MPIKAENRALYPGGSPTSPEWKALRERILQRERSCCKFCYILNGTTRSGSKIVLTIAHLDQDPTNNADENLAALCQRCHNRHDAPHRAKNASKTRHAKKSDGDLFGY